MTEKLNGNIEVRNSGGKTLSVWFNNDISRLTVGESLGPADMQGAYDRWPVYENGERVGTLFDDATGITYDAVDDDGQPLF